MKHARAKAETPAGAKRRVFMDSVLTRRFPEYLDLDPVPTGAEVVAAIAHAVTNRVRLPTCSDVLARRAAIAAIIRNKRDKRDGVSDERGG